MLPSEEELVRRLQAGDERALGVFYQHYHVALSAAVRRIVRDPHAAQDVLQESMVKIWRALALYDPNQGRLFTWAAKICCNTAIDHVRTARYRLAARTHSLDDARALALGTPGFRPEDIGVADLLRGLRPEYRHVMDLLYLQGHTQQEAAERLNVPLGTVKTWVGRSRQLLGRLPL
ncbi:sigma-70 family RNA polymerase sigma factor [Hymenobacter sp. BT770]|jgi:RNA polymerase sigma-70 factor (ECF subfamily)|uniref:RNA polymerase sigma factor n=1 Tax=Hymenobacter sp. BT770 TaxID=2886942 RepID=UPI001D10832B|nr:sigma-70 family RNA polymerase sigma factor [Hymenobacter sp. BT770]MCC3155211.1 sigma-70 family RNA polymerase sigma factor [Hymenobacter sp. BT770]MDO3417166.1 sigma-70 family RNA polymerase sigma factor [Hymenobacter sp. BT770]